MQELIGKTLHSFTYSKNVVSLNKEYELQFEDDSFVIEFNGPGNILGGIIEHAFIVDGIGIETYLSFAKDTYVRITSRKRPTLVYRKTEDRVTKARELLKRLQEELESLSTKEGLNVYLATDKFNKMEVDQFSKYYLKVFKTEEY